MTLHEAMRQVLEAAPGRRLQARALLDQINRRGLYRMRDGRAVGLQQIHARVANYPQLFVRSGDAIALTGAAAGRGAPQRVAITSTQLPPAERQGASSHSWPWEGAVQRVFVDVLAASGWSVIRTADTATKEHGVDVLASKSTRRLGAEVKGYPSRTYADPRRVGEIKPTSPTLQAGHWFSQALFKALMLLDSHPGHESLVVLPDEHRYRDLADRTRTGRARAGIHVVLLHDDGTVDSATWSP